jgi:hypothetical protein
VELPRLDERARRTSARAVIAAVLAIELFARAAQPTLASDGVAVPRPGGGRPCLISRILVWCGISLPIAGEPAQAGLVESGAGTEHSSGQARGLLPTINRGSGLVRRRRSPRRHRA